MSLFRPRKPSRAGARLSVWEMLFGGKFPFVNTNSVKWRTIGNGYGADVVFPSSGGPSGGGWEWQTPKRELDPNAPVAGPSGGIYTAVNISPENPLVTAGMLDLTTGDNLAALAGIWMALKPVPAKVVNPPGKPAGTYYNVPQLPAVNAVSGSPLAGDMDNPGLYWALIRQFTACTT